MAMHREVCLTCSNAVFFVIGVDHSRERANAQVKTQQNQGVRKAQIAPFGSFRGRPHQTRPDPRQTARRAFRRVLQTMVDKMRTRRSKEEIHELHTAIADIVEEHRPLTVRHLFYLMVAGGFIAKTEDEYRNVVVRLAGQMREEHLARQELRELLLRQGHSRAARGDRASPAALSIAPHPQGAPRDAGVAGGRATASQSRSNSRQSLFIIIYIFVFY
jgi:hypothetical protein